MNKRCCSFCRNPGHKINTCNDERLRIFEHNCLIACIEISGLYGNNHIARDNFKTWLINETLDNTCVKAFSIRNCKCKRTNNIGVCINRIVEYIFISLHIIIQQHTIYINPNIQTAINLNNNNMNDENNIFMFNNVHNYSTLSTDRLYYVSYYDMVNNANNNYLNEIQTPQKFDIEITIDIDEDNEKNDKLCECNICYDKIKKYKFIKSNCKHEFCADCFIKLLQNEKRGHPRCAYCRAYIDNIFLNEEILSEEKYKEELLEVIN
jgi:hypothetical protein